jgi:heme/copper-type cytochrome/quinol oxidase subunit 2
MFLSSLNLVADLDKKFILIIGIALFVLFCITITMITFAIRYNKKRHPKAFQFKDSIFLEIVWTIVPLILVMLMFYYGHKAFLPQRKIPKGAIPITVISKMHKWSYYFYSGKIDGDGLFIKNFVYVPDYDIVKGNSKGLMKSFKSVISSSQMTEIFNNKELIINY